MLIKTHITVTGDVQGIGYRYFVKRLADNFGIKGYVRNKFDKSVELDIECANSTLNEFIQKLKHGHPWAKVDNIHMSDSSYQSIYSTFEIK